MMLVIAILATLLALIQNLIMFAGGMKENAIYSSPFFFTGIFLLEIALIWVAFFCVRKFVRQKRELVLAGCAILTLGVAEFALPASFFTILIQHAERKYVLNRIRHVGTSIEPLSSDDGGTRFALTYTLTFPKTRPYLTYPATVGPEDNQVFGYYFHKLHPEYDDEKYVYEAGKPYSFTVVLDTKGKTFDFSKEKAHIDICDSKDYFMACRIINIGLEGAPAALANPAPAGKIEPDVPAGNIPDLTEKSIRLAGLAVSETNKSGEPISLSYEITNTGKGEIAIPGDQFGRRSPRARSRQKPFLALGITGMPFQPALCLSRFGRAPSRRERAWQSTMWRGLSSPLHPENTGCMFSSSAAMPPTRASQSRIWSRRSASSPKSPAIPGSAKRLAANSQAQQLPETHSRDSTERGDHSIPGGANLCLDQISGCRSGVTH
jgi:hypothetical protein